MLITYPEKQPRQVQTDFAMYFRQIQTQQEPSKNVRTSHIKDDALTNFEINKREFLDNCRTTLSDRFYQRSLALLEMPDNYIHYEIPKHSGGTRPIDEPKPELMQHLTEVKDELQKLVPYHYHNNAYAYIKKRTALDAIKQHQENHSNWFYKTDIKDFFPNCNLNTIMNQLNKIYPFTILFKEPAFKRKFRTIIKSGLLNNKLPQGSPLSPLITNMIMLPFDFHLSNILAKKGMIYTRYSDDMLISSEKPFKPEHITEIIEDIFRQEGYPYTLHADKTRYGSKKGKNWNLGLMLNKDNEITIGHRQKKTLKNALQSFFIALTKNQPWSIIETQILQGEIEYYKSIEKEKIEYIIACYEMKFKRDLYKSFKAIINQRSLNTHFDETPRLELIRRYNPDKANTYN